MNVYYYEIVYQSKHNPLRVSRYLAKIPCRQQNYGNMLFDKAIMMFCRDRNADSIIGEYDIISVKYLNEKME